MNHIDDNAKAMIATIENAINDTDQLLCSSCASNKSYVISAKSMAALVNSLKAYGIVYINPCDPGASKDAEKA